MKQIVGVSVKNLGHSHKDCVLTVKTLQALEEGKHGEGLEEYKGVEELFNWLRNV